jgi:hypothetical protein
VRLRKSWIIKGKLASTVNTVAAEKLFDIFDDYVEQELDLLPTGGFDLEKGTFNFIITREDESPVLIENKINRIKTWLAEQREVAEVEVTVR